MSMSASASVHVPFIEILSSDAIHCNTIILINELHEIVQRQQQQHSFTACAVYFAAYCIEYIIIESIECTLSAQDQNGFVHHRKKHLCTCVLCVSVRLAFIYVFCSHSVSVRYICVCCSSKHGWIYNYIKEITDFAIACWIFDWILMKTDAEMIGAGTVHMLAM